jgi:hypothetical protein
MPVAPPVMRHTLPFSENILGMRIADHEDHQGCTHSNTESDNFGVGLGVAMMLDGVCRSGRCGGWCGEDVNATT